MVQPLSRVPDNERNEVSNVYTAQYETAELLELPGRDVRIYIGTDKSTCPVKSDHMTMGLTTVPAHSDMMPHTHFSEEEIIFILEGEGEVIVGGVCEPLKPLVAVKFPLGVEHQVRNTGSTEMRFVFMFNPVFTFGK